MIFYSTDVKVNEYVEPKVNQLENTSFPDPINYDDKVEEPLLDEDN